VRRASKEPHRTDEERKRIASLKKVYHQRVGKPVAEMKRNNASPEQIKAFQRKMLQEKPPESRGRRARGDDAMVVDGDDEEDKKIPVSWATRMYTTRCTRHC